MNSAASEATSPRTRIPLSALAGPLIVGAAVWCAAGTMTVAVPDSAARRLALAAPWWLLPLAVAAAAFVPAWRSRPALAAPALLSTLPWWPIALPPIALLWTGPLAWLPVLAALGCAVGARPLTLLARAVPSGPRKSTALAGAVTLAVSTAVAWNVSSHVPTGDEPHYLMIAQSLLADHDLRIENNHRQREYGRFFDGELAPDYVRRGRDGEIYSIHAPGLPALVLPAYAVFGYRGAQAWVLLLAAMTGALVWRLGWRATGDRSAAWFAWAAIVSSPTFLFHSFALFPDGPAALIVAASALVLLSLDRRPETVRARRLVGISVLLAALPWLHTRFAILSAGFGLAFGLDVLRDSSRPMASRQARLLLFLAVPLASALCWFGFFQWIYGTLNPAAPYGGTGVTRADYIPGGLAGLLFDEQFGLFTYAPVLALVVVGTVRSTGRETRWTVRATLAVAVTYLAAVATYWLWWAGSPASPARFAVSVLPVGAIPLAELWRTGDEARRRVMLALLAVSVAIAAVVAGLHHGDFGWNDRTGDTLWLQWLGPLVNLSRAWPSFFWALDPAALRTEVPFLLHGTAWAAIFAGGWYLLRLTSVHRAWSAQAWRLAISGWILCGLMAASQVGWWIDGSPGLEPARSQTAVLAGTGPAVEIGPLTLRHLPTLESALVIRTEEVGRNDGAGPWLALEEVPAGTYALRITTSRAAVGSLAVTVGESPRPVGALGLKALDRQAASLTLPIGARALVLAPRDLDGVSGRIELEPLQLNHSAPLAWLGMPYGSVNVYFLDDHVFAEDDGFWVAGARSAHVVLASRSAEPPSSFRLDLQGGRGANDVTLDALGVIRHHVLRSFETRTIDVPCPASGLLRLTITSSSGFRPSDDGVSRDRRYLGVRVRVE